MNADLDRLLRERIINPQEARNLELLREVKRQAKQIAALLDALTYVREDGRRWTLLNGGEDVTDLVARVLGVES